MSARRTLGWFILLAAGAFLGCRARLPVGGPPSLADARPLAAAAGDAAPIVASEAAPVAAVRAARARGRGWPVAGPGEERGMRLGDGYHPPIDPDRLLDVVRYNPLPAGRNGLGGFILRIDTCVPGGHGR